MGWEPDRSSATLDSEEAPAMPLRDHFRPPLTDRRSWEGLHGGWPMMIVIGLNRRLPQRYVAEPQVHLGSSDRDRRRDLRGGRGRFPRRPASEGDGGGVATAVWAPPRPTLAVATDLPALDEYEVRVYDTKSGRRLVAAVEIVSPANKDRPEHRRAFVAKCAALLQDRVCVAIVDLVTTRTSNLYRDLLELFGQTDPSLADGPPPLYAVVLPLGEEWRRLAPGDLDASPDARPAVADAAALARREPRGTARAGTELRGDVPHPPHPVGLVAVMPPGASVRGAVPSSREGARQEGGDLGPRAAAAASKSTSMAWTVRGVSTRAWPRRAGSERDLGARALGPARPRPRG